MSATRLWEKYYKQAESVWEEKPDWILLEHASLVPPGQVLDLGMGEGRNALFFALQEGYEVAGIDASETAIQRASERAQKLGVSLAAEVGNLLDTPIPPNSFSLIMSTMTLQFLKKSQAEAAIARMRQGLKPGGILYLTAFSMDDPMYARCKQALPEVEPETFERDGNYFHFFQKDEVLTQLADLKLIHFAQQILLDQGHAGASDPHYHGIIAYMGQKV